MAAQKSYLAVEKIAQSPTLLGRRFITKFKKAIFGHLRFKMNAALLILAKCLAPDLQLLSKRD